LEQHPKAADFVTFIQAQEFKVLKGPAESRAFQRLPLTLTGNFKPIFDSISEDGSKVVLRPGSAPKLLDGIGYIEYPNSSLYFGKNPKTGQPRLFMFPRGIREYKTNFDLNTGAVSQDGYASDVLLYELKTSDASLKLGGEPQFIHRLLESKPKQKIIFEDPRISRVLDDQGRERVLLSGTDYSSHISGSTDPDVMNRYVEIQFDAEGTPLSVPLNEDGRPAYRNLSPPPFKIGNQWITVDAKNATVSRNEFNEVVVRVRLRPDFSIPYIQELAGSRSWKYGEQSFIFKNYEAFENYDWSNALFDLFEKESPNSRTGSRPVKVAILLEDQNLVEQFHDPTVLKEKGKGLGPGTAEVRIRREGLKIWVSHYKGAPEYLSRPLTEEESAGFPLKDGDVKYINFGHEIRYFKDKVGSSEFVNRSYTSSFRLSNSRLTEIELYYADAIQPTTSEERGEGSGVTLLQHVYPMSAVVLPSGEILTMGGGADAHSPGYLISMTDTLVEMSEGSLRRTSGQVYKPRAQVPG